MNTHLFGDFWPLVFLRLPAAVRARARQVCGHWSRLLDARGAWQDISTREQEDRAHRACVHGRLLSVQWLARVFCWSADAVYGHWNCAFTHACASGQLNVAQWLAADFGLAAMSQSPAAAPGATRALTRACAGGHTATAQWLVVAFRLAPADVNVNNLVATACRHGKLDTAQWLVAAFGPPGPLSAYGRIAMSEAREAGDDLTVQWMSATFGPLD
jgi:hypothetical protein